MFPYPQLPPPGPLLSSFHLAPPWVRQLLEIPPSRVQAWPPPLGPHGKSSEPEPHWCREYWPRGAGRRSSQHSRPQGIVSPGSKPYAHSKAPCCSQRPLRHRLGEQRKPRPTLDETRHHQCPRSRSPPNSLPQDSCGLKPLRVPWPGDPSQHCPTQLSHTATNTPSPRKEKKILFPLSTAETGKFSKKC